MELFVKIGLKIKKKIFLKACLNYLLKKIEDIAVTSPKKRAVHHNRGLRVCTMLQIY